MKGDIVMKNLKTIQVLSRIGLVLSRIKLVCSLVGFAGCVISIIILSRGNGSGTMSAGGFVFHGLISVGGGHDADGTISVIAAWLVVCAGGAVIAWFARCYFLHELADGTPFTEAGARELGRLGILEICITVGTAIIARGVQAVVAGLMDVSTDAAFDVWSGDETLIVLGIAMMIAALLCSHGAELTAKGGENGSIDNADVV